jgi:hypothetical protein
MDRAFIQATGSLSAWDRCWQAVATFEAERGQCKPTKEANHQAFRYRHSGLLMAWRVLHPTKHSRMSRFTVACSASMAMEGRAYLGGEKRVWFALMAGWSGTAR